MGNGFHYDAVDRRFYYTYATPGGSEIRSVNLDGSDVRPMAQYVSTMYWMEAGHGIVVPGSGTEPPTITCPANMIVTADPGQCCAVVNFTVNATDDCGEVPVVCTPPSGSVFPKGTTTVTCTATDAGGQTATCTFTVTVNDTENPTITCPANIVTSTDAGQCSTVVTYTVTAADNCGGVSVTCTPPSGSTFPTGTTTVTATATDSAGNQATGSFTVTVNDTEAPVVTCPANIVTSTDAGQCSAVVTYAVTGTDNCGGAIVTCTPPSGATFPKGTTTVTATATDSAGNVATGSFTVTVNDTEAPAITCPANIALPCGVDWLLPAAFAATATDNCDPAPTVSYSIPPGSGFPIGATAATVTATDASGNASQCAFTITRAALGFAGFLPPIGGADATGGSFIAPVRSFKLKSTIPVKFTAFCDGSPVLAGVHTLQAIKWSNETDSDPPIDATPTDAATTGNEFRLVDSEWHYNLDTLATGLSVGKWQLIATLSDGSQHSVWIQIK
jgi:flavin reductase (DIM6/NTAB) family NADH-FMN oxidoreductase RutF